MAYVPPIPAPGYPDRYKPSWMTPHMYRWVPPFRPQGKFPKPNGPSYAVPQIPSRPPLPAPHRRSVITTSQQRNGMWST